MALKLTSPLVSKVLLYISQQRFTAPVMLCRWSTVSASSVWVAALGPGPIHGHVRPPQPAVLHASPAAPRALHAADAVAGRAALWSLAAEYAAHPAASAAGLAQDRSCAEAILAALGLL